MINLYLIYVKYLFVLNGELTMVEGGTVIERKERERLV